MCKKRLSTANQDGSQPLMGYCKIIIFCQRDVDSWQSGTQVGNHNAHIFILPLLTDAQLPEVNFFHQQLLFDGTLWFCITVEDCL